MKIHLIRHGKAQRPYSGKDFDRPLNNKGKKQTIELGLHLYNKAIEPKVFCSGAIRTRQTLDQLLIKNKWLDITYSDALYLCSTKDFLELIWNYSGDKDLLIVGHNFGISDLLNYFTDEGITMQTGSYFCIDFNNLKVAETSRSTGIICDQFRYYH